MASARIEQTLEQFQQDERLTTDLSDMAANALLGWIEQQVQAADQLADAEAFEQQVAAIRTAAHSAASTRSLDPTADSVVAQAQAALQAGSARSAAPTLAPPAAIAAPDSTTAAPVDPASSPAAALIRQWHAENPAPAPDARTVAPAPEVSAGSATPSAPVSEVSTAPSAPALEPSAVPSTSPEPVQLSVARAADASDPDLASNASIWHRLRRRVRRWTHRKAR